MKGEYANMSMLTVSNLTTMFSTERGLLTALDGISFTIEANEIVGLVGESGSGKSVTAQSILRLYDEKSSVQYQGEVTFEGKNISVIPEPEMRKIRGNEISMIFQDPMSALNPVYTLGDQIMEAIHLHQKVSSSVARAKAIEILTLTGMPAPEKRIDEYPHQLSGGMRQRALIAIALSCRPKLLIADEPTTALDVTIQAQILDLIQEMNKDFDMGMIFITHDLGVVSEICDRVMVMYLGQIIEHGNTSELFRQPLHPYTRGLLKCIPTMEGDRNIDLYTIEGSVPSLTNVPSGCRFAARCPYADELCRTQVPELKHHQGSQSVRCWHYKEILEKEG